jgi:arylsulfatase A-like enzyme
MGILCVANGATSHAQEKSKPNVLMISLDDLNDWIEPMAGHPQTITPNLSSFAKEAVSFHNAYCASPSCNPSRTALMTGKAPYRTGVYTNPQIWRHILPDEIMLPEHFKQAGYWAGGAGKIYHNNMPDPRSWDDYYPSLIQHFPYYYLPDIDSKTGQTIFRKQDNELREDSPQGLTLNMPTFDDMYIAFDWAPLPHNTEETGDYASAKWIVEQLGKKHDKPFFLGCGIYRPHLPFYVPQKYFDKFPLESIQLPKTLKADWDDIPKAGRKLARSQYHENVLKAGEWEKAVQGYLASINYADELTGMVLDALAASEYSDNTIVIVYSDHGWQLGEKQHWQKHALWENLINSVLMIKVPEGLLDNQATKNRGSVSYRNVSLVDIYPTLVELCGLPEKEGLTGQSLTPLLIDPTNKDWNHPIISMQGSEYFSVRKEDWHFIYYNDLEAELYDLKSDPEEWDNLARRPEYADTIIELKGYIPGEKKQLIKTKPILWADVLSGKTKLD